MGYINKKQSLRFITSFRTIHDFKLVAVVLLISLSSTTITAQGIVQFSHPAGFYDSEITLALSANPGDQIFYTLDGSVPDINSLRFISPFLVGDRLDDEPELALISGISHNYSPWVPPSGPVQLITVIRARAYNAGEWGETVTGSYIITEHGTNRYRIAVLSLVTPKENLFDYETGIYVLGKVYDDYKRNNPTATDGLATPANYTQRGDEWERPAHIELFEPDGTRPLAQNIGIRIHGGGSRSFQQKSIRLYAKSDYGTSKFEYQLFPDQELDEYKRLILRNSGQDWMKTSLRDGFMHTLVRHLPFETMAYKPTVLFINGEFWGIANIRERYDKKFMESKFDVDEDEVDHLSGNAAIEEGSADHYNAMLTYIRNGGVSDMQRYRHLQTQMNTESFMYYNLANIYYNNRDWPHNNVEYWRGQADYDPSEGPGRDGRWRWMMKDTDFGMAWTDIHTENTYRWQVSQDYLAHATRPGHWSTFLLHELLKNEEFKRDFINGYRDLMNTAFHLDRTLKVLEQIQSTIEPHAVEHINRWGNSNHRWSMPRDLSEWNTNVGFIRRFLHEREEFVNDHFADKFNLGDLYTLRVAVSDTTMGYIRINKIDLRRPTPGLVRIDYPNTVEMQYFEGHPVTVKAVAFEGFKFSHWVDGLSDADSIVVTGPINELVAVFKQTGSVSVGDSSTEIPTSIELEQNHPNPFNPTTQIWFALPEAQQVTIRVFDITGRVVAELLNNVKYSAGSHKVTFDGSELSSGIYIYTMTTDTRRSLSRKLLLLK
jgi:hypothetical protein